MQFKFNKHYKIIANYNKINIPRDDFQPRVIQNYENDISGIEDQVIGMYSKGMSTRDILEAGVKDILIASVDGLTGFSDAIKTVFPNTEIQRCVVHQIRNTLGYVSYKHRKEFARDLKNVYTALTEDVALNELELLKY